MNSHRSVLALVALALPAVGIPAQGIVPRKTIQPFVPTGRAWHGAAFDATRGRMVVFGGATASGAVNETLETDGATWFRLAPATAPSARFGVQMAFDPDTNRCHMFGGNADNLLWSWDGTNWSSSNRGAFVLPRTGHAMAYHTGLKRLVLFGGNNHDFGLLGDTWEYDVNAGWTAVRMHINTPSPIPALRGATMAMVPILSGVLMFGGLIGNGQCTGYTHVWNGTSWSDAGGGGPDRRTDHAMCYDPDTHVIVVFGGYDGSKTLGDVWCGYGLKWIERTPAAGKPGPGPRRGATLVYDSKAKKCVLFGGQDASAGYPAEVWDFDNNTLSWAQRQYPTAGEVPRVRPPFKR